MLEMDFGENTAYYTVVCLCPFGCKQGYIHAHVAQADYQWQHTCVTKMYTVTLYMQSKQKKKDHPEVWYSQSSFLYHVWWV